VLDSLPLPAGAGPAGIYRHVTDVAQLQGAIAQMVSFSQEAQQVVPLPGAPTAPDSDPDPVPVAQQSYFRLDAKVSRLALAVEWASAADTLQLSRRDWDPVSLKFTGPFGPVSATVAQCPTHGYIGVDVAALFGDENSVVATEWRVVHTSGGVPQAIPPADLLVFVDLYAKVEITFDRTQYATGDPMIVTARVRAGSKPVLDASVHVELARPGESLGTFLATNSQYYKPATTVSGVPTSSTHGGPQRGSADPPAAKPAMLRQLLDRLDWQSLPILTPSQIFDDGTDQLFDDGFHHDGAASDGDYANRYTGVDKEGTYTWRVTITGRLPDGSPFTRLVVISRWVGIHVDPATSPVTWKLLTQAPAGFRAAEIRVVPRDARGEFLGPFWSSAVEFRTTAGSFDGDMISDPSGAYIRRLVYPQRETPQVTIMVQGKAFAPTVIAGGCLGLLWKLLGPLLVQIKRLLGE
jgi:hypothetical protein